MMLISTVTAGLFGSGKPEIVTVREKPLALAQEKGESIGKAMHSNLIPPFQSTDMICVTEKTARKWCTIIKDHVRENKIIQLDKFLTDLYAAHIIDDKTIRNVDRCVEVINVDETKRYGFFEHIEEDRETLIHIDMRRYCIGALEVLTDENKHQAIAKVP